ncbi:MAG TPA: FGGY family carbohydrate kinase [Acidimicrobiales bacterium]|nr:FGGY family carbohydrate kinase [Acidimicrobiales bacterium]
MAEPLLLGLDLGTTRTKAVLVDARGRQVRAMAAPTPFVRGEGGVEMDVGALLVTARRVVAGLGADRDRVAAVGIAGMAECGAPLDRSGRPLAPVIGWHDGRGQEAIDRLEREFGGGLADRVGQPLRTVMTVAKLGWLVEHGVGPVHRWLGVPELVLHALTGADATEFSLAARTGCYDVGERRWIPEVAGALGFGIGVFPPVQGAGTVMGRVSPAGSAWSGLPVGIPVTIAGHDHLAGLAGAGVGASEVANSVGTAETLVARAAALPDVAAAAPLRVAVTVLPGGRQWAALVSAARSGIVIEAAGGAEAVDAASLVDSLIAGRVVELPDAPAGAVWAGLLAALAARTAHAYRRLEQVVGPARGVVVFGGGSVSRPWLAAKAAALPLPVRRSPVASAVGAGAARGAAMAAGWRPPSS